MSKVQSLAFITFLILTVNVKAQEQIVNQFNSWWYYSGTFKFGEKWTGNLLYSWSRHDFVKYWQISKLGLRVNHNLSENFGVGGSYEWAIIFPYGQLPIPEKRREHRFLERVYFRDKINQVSLRSAFDLEQYFSNSDFLHRARISIGVKLPLVKNCEGMQVLGLSFFEQVFINGGNEPIRLGQNRYYGGIDIRLNNNFSLALGYLNQYIIIRPTLIENDHTLMVGVIHHVELSQWIKQKHN